MRKIHIFINTFMMNSILFLWIQFCSTLLKTIIIYGLAKIAEKACKYRYSINKITGKRYVYLHRQLRETSDLLNATGDDDDGCATNYLQIVMRESYPLIMLFTCFV